MEENNQLENQADVVQDFSQQEPGQNQENHQPESSDNKGNKFFLIFIVVSVLILVGACVFWFVFKKPVEKNIQNNNSSTIINNEKPLLQKLFLICTHDAKVLYRILGSRDSFANQTE